MYNLSTFIGIILPLIGTTLGSSMVYLLKDKLDKNEINQAPVSKSTIEHEIDIPFLHDIEQKPHWDVESLFLPYQTNLEFDISEEYQVS